MILNDFISFKVGAEFEDKYNALAVKEILENEEKYPNIAEGIVSRTEYAVYRGKEWDFDSDFFDCDDLELCANYDETMELYRAFVSAFAKDVKGKPLKVSGVSFGLRFLEYPHVGDILDPHFHFLRETEIYISNKTTTLSDDVFYPSIPGNIAAGPESVEQYSHKFNSENAGLLRKISDEFKQMCECDCFFVNRFTSEELKEHPTLLKNGEVGYPFDYYRFSIGKNRLCFFTTERGFDAFGIIRYPILEALTEAQKENEVVKTIVNIG